jgi:hypothetical protein
MDVDAYARALAGAAHFGVALRSDRSREIPQHIVSNPSSEAFSAVAVSFMPPSKYACSIVN